MFPMKKKVQYRKDCLTLQAEKTELMCILNTDKMGKSVLLGNSLTCLLDTRALYGSVLRGYIFKVSGRDANDNLYIFLDTGIF